MIDIKNVEWDTIEWAKDRGIIPNATTQTQALKLASEVGELLDDIAKGNDVRDELGDCIVVLTIIANLEGTNLTECFNMAYNKIKDRKGYLTKDGVFIKESDERYKQLTMDFK